MSDRNIPKLAKVNLSIHPIFHSQVDSRSPVIVQKSKETPKVSEQLLCFNFFNSFLYILALNSFSPCVQSLEKG